MLIDKIKALFNSEAVENKTVKNKFKDAKLIDGTIVRVEGDEFKVGDALKVMTEEGELIQAPEGMHETTDGEIFVVNAEGKITEIRKPEVKVETEKTEEAPAVESTTEEMTSEEKEEEKMEGETETEIEVEKPSLEERIAALEEALAMLVSNLEAKKEEMEAIKKENENLKLKNEELSKVPAAEPTKTKRFEKVIADKKDSKINVELLSKVSALREKNK